MPFSKTITEPSERSRLFWKLQSAGWVGLVPLVVLFSGFSFLGWREAVGFGLFRTSVAFVITCLLRLGYRYLRRNPGNIWFYGGVVFLTCCVVGVLDGLLTQFAAQRIGINFDTPGLQKFMLVTLLMRWVLYWFWSVLYFGISYWLDTQQTSLQLARVEAAARTVELHTLRAQVNPHFLFNALGSILAVSENPASARRLTLALAEYLRFSLQQRHEREPLGAELKALESYLQVEKARFEENFEYRIQTDEQARKVPVPSATVQPLLENAIKYGQRSARRPLKVGISAMVEGECLLITVTNSGEWIEANSSAPMSTQTGLANLRRRLQLLYGSRATLCIESGEGEVRAQIQLPLTTGKPTAISLKEAHTLLATLQDAPQ